MIKIEVGNACPIVLPLHLQVRGRDLLRSTPKTITVNESEVRDALCVAVNTIISGIRSALERTPPELFADISERGIVVTGGVALTRKLGERMRSETGSLSSSQMTPY